MCRGGCCIVDVSTTICSQRACTSESVGVITAHSPTTFWFHYPCTAQSRDSSAKKYTNKICKDNLSHPLYILCILVQTQHITEDRQCYNIHFLCFIGIQKLEMIPVTIGSQSYCCPTFPQLVGLLSRADFELFVWEEEDLKPRDSNPCRSRPLELHWKQQRTLKFTDLDYKDHTLQTFK